MCVCQVLIQGLQNLNRAVHQDVVAVELFPKERWVAPSAVVLQDDQQNDEDAEEEEAEKKVRTSLIKCCQTCSFPYQLIACIT